MKNMRRRLISTICALALIANASAITSMAQPQGEIIVVITDFRGAIIRGAAVTATDTANVATRATSRDDAGVYRLPLSPAIYTLRIEKAGFMRAERTGVQVQAGQTVRLDVALEVGAITESVDITAVDQAGSISSSPKGIIRNIVKGARIGGASAFQFFSQEMGFENKLVTGAPFSADIASETIQMLADGTRISQEFAGRIYRDSQGRTRTERAFRIGGTSESIQTITINDPVIGASYILDPETRIAEKTDVPAKITPPLANAVAPKTTMVGSEVIPGQAIKKVAPAYPTIAKAARASGEVLVQVSIGESGEVIDEAVISGHPLLREATVQAARKWIFRPTLLSGKPVKIRGILRFNFILSDEGQDASTTKYTVDTEQLNDQLVEGIKCKGERKVSTMPAGAIGNDRPIETVSETWYSPELSMMILSKRSDPRFGESTYRVTSINRSEPEASLFQVPAEFTIKESGKH